ncbi:MAG TPA: DUF2196 domain-containing protein [Symbiobacteriaceae bacterium]|nr:DUF2196 domain-containing protein [Symbiobacteriaceae bacterium]
MSHTIRANLTDLKSLATALKDLEWYTSPAGGYRIAGVAADGSTAAWELEARPAEAKAAPVPAPERRRTVEPGDQVIVETKAQQVARRFGSGDNAGVEGVVFRVLTRGPHPHGMKVELRDRTVGRVLRNLTMPGAGEPTF